MPRTQPPVCGTLEIVRTHRSAYGDDVVFMAQDAGRRVGVITANHVADPLGLQVSWVRVAGYAQRCGVATKLYTAMAQAACDAGGVLSSDMVRAPTTEAFWQKQVAKGRARCVRHIKNPQPGASDCETYALKRCPVETLARPVRRAS